MEEYESSYVDGVENTDVELLDHQYDFLNQVVNGKTKHHALITGIGGGKTYINGVIVHEFTDTYPGAPGLLLAPTLSVFIDSTYAGMSVYFDAIGATHRVLTSGAKKYLYLNGTRHLIRTLNHPDTIEGVKAAWVSIDEGGTGKAVGFKKAMGRARDPKGPRKTFLTSSPKGRAHYTHDFFVKDLVKNPALSKNRFIMHSIDSETNTFLTDDYIESLGEDYTGQYRKQEKGGQFVQFEGAVWEIKTRTGYQVKKDRSFELSIDFGRNQPCVGFFQEDPIMIRPGVFSGKSKDVMFDYLAKGDRIISDVIHGIRSKMDEHKLKNDPAFIYCDPAGDSGNAMEYKSEIDVVRNAFPGSSVIYNWSAYFRSIQKGIIAVMSRFDRGLLEISAELNRTRSGDYGNPIEALEGIAYPEIREGVSDITHYVKNDGTNYDHFADMVRYFVINKHPPTVRQMSIEQRRTRIAQEQAIYRN